MVRLLAFILLFLSVPEVALVSYFLGTEYQLYPLIASAFLVLIVFLYEPGKIKIIKRDIAFLLLYTLSICSLLLGSIYHSDFSNYIKLISQILLFLIFYIAIDAKSIPYKAISIFEKCFMLIGFLAIVSWILFIIYPIRGDTFENFTGHVMTPIYGSFTNSIMYLGSMQIPRMSGIFDEPGTFGMVFGVIGSIYWSFDSSNKKAALFWLLGLSSLSFSYILCIICIVFFIFFYKIIDIDIKRVKINASRVTLIAVLILLSVFYLYYFHDYISRRLVGLFAGSHNRAEGFSIAIELINKEPLFGIGLEQMSKRLLKGSGLLNVTAYTGILFMLFSVMGAITYCMKVLNLKRINDFPFYIFMIVWILHRNNMFNISGFVFLLMFYLICLCLNKNNMIRQNYI